MNDEILIVKTLLMISNVHRVFFETLDHSERWQGEILYKLKLKLRSKF